MLSDLELRAIVIAALRGRPEGSSEDEVELAVERALDWGNKVRTQGLLLDLVIKGDVAIAVTPTGELRFQRVNIGSQLPPPVKESHPAESH